MGTDDEVLSIEAQQRLRANLDRFMQSGTLRQARDIVAEEPLLLGVQVSNFLSEAAKRLRQTGDVHEAEACEFRLSILRTFREFGLQDGYLELAIDAITRAKTPEGHYRVLRETPELTEEATFTFISRRIKESVNDDSRVLVMGYM